MKRAAGSEKNLRPITHINMEAIASSNATGMDMLTLMRPHSKVKLHINGRLSSFVGGLSGHANSNMARLTCEEDLADLTHPGR